MAIASAVIESVALVASSSSSPPSPCPSPPSSSASSPSLGGRCLGSQALYLLIEWQEVAVWSLEE